MEPIIESGMDFSILPEDRVYQIEKSEAYKSLGHNIRVVEFVYRQADDKLLFVEAKSSSPRPVGNDFSKFLEEISEKFIHSFNLWLTLNLMRREDDVPEKVLNVPTDSHIFRFILIINGHEKAWLPPVKAALEKKMRAEIKIWKHEIIVLNEKQARDRHLIKTLE